jgi:hypothetical protein
MRKKPEFQTLFAPGEIFVHGSGGKNCTPAQKSVPIIAPGAAT